MVVGLINCDIQMGCKQNRLKQDLSVTLSLSILILENITRCFSIFVVVKSKVKEFRA